MILGFHSESSGLLQIAEQFGTKGIMSLVLYFQQCPVQPISPIVVFEELTEGFQFSQQPQRRTLNFQNSRFTSSRDNDRSIARLSAEHGHLTETSLGLNVAHADRYALIIVDVHI